MERAVLDRFEDQNLAVLLVGEQEKEYHVDRNLVPNEAKESSLLLVSVRDDEITTILFDEDASTKQTERIHSKMKKLRERKNIKKND